MMSDYGTKRKWFGFGPKRTDEFAAGVNHTTNDPAPVAQEPTHGPWATHGPNCKCNVCR